MRILIVSEFTGLGTTGYSTYYKEIAKALHGAGHEIIELASYGDANIATHVRYQRTSPWKIILNQPHQSQKRDVELYNQRERTTGDAKFGSWAFDEVCSQLHPDVVLAVRDHWYDKFIIDSPAANYYVSVLQPTCDARSQKADWLDTFGRADIITNYTEWAENWFKTQYSAHNLTSFISPSADDAYKPLLKSQCRSALGIPQSIKLVGTVMRNQRRKKFAHLFEAISHCPDVYLYAHTAYPDRGWDIPTLLLQHNIAHKTYMTFMCMDCHYHQAYLFSTRCPKCPKCGGGMETPSARSGLSNDELCRVYNTMDLYVQCINSEGLGIPVLEAAKCGIRVATIDYSAQEDVGPRVGAIMMKPHSLDTEIETGCYRAIPDIQEMISVFNNPETYKYSKQAIIETYNRNYSWDMTGKKWVNLIGRINPKNKWDTEPVIRNPASFEQLESLRLSNSEFMIACILNVAHDAKLLGSYMHTECLDGLNAGMIVVQGGEGSVVRVDRKWVYNRYRAIIERRNKWESERVQIRKQFLSHKK